MTDCYFYERYLRTTGKWHPCTSYGEPMFRDDEICRNLTKIPDKDFCLPLDELTEKYGGLRRRI